MNPEEKIHAALASGKMDSEKLEAKIVADARLLESVFQGTSSKLPRVKFGCSKALMILSMKRPDLLYGKVEEVVALLDSENRILKWNAIAMLGNLAPVDREGRIPGLLKRLFGFLSSGELITANNAIAALGKIGRALPGEKDRIASRLLEVEKCSFDTDECRNIAIGKAILALGSLVRPADADAGVLEFARRQVGNRRKATGQKAEALVRKLSPGVTAAGT
jgi:hypothetical protein